MGAGRSGTCNAGANSAIESFPNVAGTEGTNASPEGSARPSINGSTQGVVGNPNLKLEPATEYGTGSVLSSGEKNNVKVEAARSAATGQPITVVFSPQSHRATEKNNQEIDFLCGSVALCLCGEVC